MSLPVTVLQTFGEERFACPHEIFLDIIQGLQKELS
jgi:hypothetical protein